MITLLLAVPSGQGEGRSSFTRKESAVECSFTGKEPAIEYEVEKWKVIKWINDTRAGRLANIWAGP